MPKSVSFALVFLSIFLFMFVGVLLGRQITREPRAQSNYFCTISTTNVLKSGFGDVYNFDGITEFKEPNFAYLSYYTVTGDEITLATTVESSGYVVDLAKQQEAWKVFTQLIPPQDRAMVAQFNIFSDGFENTLAAVDQVKEDTSYWMLEVDVADLENRPAFIFTMIHEYAHILTLNETQAEPDLIAINNLYDQEVQQERAAACPTYFTGMGCSRSDSYMQAFYDRFWVDIRTEWDKVDTLQYQGDSVAYYNALYDFYITHKDQFVGDYAATHPAEDIAESFTHFVFSPKPIGNTIRDQKILFFYDYPELVRLRNDILSGVCALDT